MCLNSHTVFVSKARARTDTAKTLGPVGTAEEGDAVVSGRLNHTDANKLGRVALANSKDQNASANISFQTKLPEE